MKKLLLATTALAALGSAAVAGGIERTTQSPAILFEEGRYMELSFSSVSPTISGVGVAATTGTPSGDMAPSYLNFGLAYKADLNDTLSYALIYDQPFGADADYPVTGYFASGSTAEFRSHALTSILQYNLGNGGSVYGGLRAQTIQAEASLLPLSATPYTVESDRSFDLGYVVGAAYEKPEIALRVALTYTSAIAHDVSVRENGTATPDIEVETPQSWNLEFQSGVAENTLVFGSVRWVEWSEFDITPVGYAAANSGDSIVSYDDDRITYTLGIGRRLNETWSVLGSVSYEETTGSQTGNLGPTDGFTSIGVGAVYTKDNMKVTGGVRYIDIGDANTRVPGTPGPTAGAFTDNSAVAAGVRVGWSF